MLQAVEQFELYTGVRPDRALVEKASEFLTPLPDKSDSNPLHRSLCSIALCGMGRSSLLLLAVSF